MIDNSEKFNGGKTGLVEQEILRQIDLGNFRRNSLLPSERELAKQLGVSYMTGPAARSGNWLMTTF